MFLRRVTSAKRPYSSNVEIEKDKPTAARYFPTRVELEAGKTYSWCSCGLSAKQPFCDGNHKYAKGLSPLRFTPSETKKYLLCMCKQTSTPPYCSGHHIVAGVKKLCGLGGDEMSQARKTEIEKAIKDAKEAKQQAKE